MYEFTGKVRYSEADSNGNLSLVSLLDYFQDCSAFQSEALDIGLNYLKKNHIAWVLSSWQIVVERYPRLCEEVTAGTMAYDFRGFLGKRNFYMKDITGKKIAYANSLWVLINTDTMKPVQLPQKILDAYPVEPRLQMDYAPRKIKVPDDEENAVLEEKEEIIVKPYHLDTNHHVNNGQYIRMSMGFLPENIKIRQLRAEYKKSAYLGDVMYPVVIKRENGYMVSLRDKESKPYVNVEFTLEQGE